MKVLLNTYSMAYQVPGGGEVIIDKIFEQLKRKGIDVKKFSPFEDKLIDYDLVHHFSTIDWHLWKDYKNYNLPVVLTPTAWPKDDAMTLFKKNFKNQVKSLIAKKQYDYSIDNFFQYIDHITPTTELESERVKKYYELESKNFTVIPNGVDIDTEAKAIDQVELPPIYILFVGRVAKIKNVLPLIEAIVKTDFKLVIAGDAKPGEEEYYDQCIDTANEQIQFLGAVNDRANLNYLYQNAFYTIVPSVFETCSLVALESMSQGTNVLITEVGGTKEVFQDYANYLNPTNSNTIADDILNFTPSKTSQELTQFVAKNYSWESIVDNLIHVYKETIKGRQS